MSVTQSLKERILAKANNKYKEELAAKESAEKTRLYRYNYLATVLTAVHDELKTLTSLIIGTSDPFRVTLNLPSQTITTNCGNLSVSQSPDEYNFISLKGISVRPRISFELEHQKEEITFILHLFEEEIAKYVRVAHPK